MFEFTDLTQRLSTPKQQQLLTTKIQPRKATLNRIAARSYKNRRSDKQTSTPHNWNTSTFKRSMATKSPTTMMTIGMRSLSSLSFARSHLSNVPFGFIGFATTRCRLALFTATFWCDGTVNMVNMKKNNHSNKKRHFQCNAKCAGQFNVAKMALLRLSKSRPMDDSVDIKQQQQQLEKQTLPQKV
ncbi:unnamed protein product [Ceratitis capitata]|uniref:(Mediterranean fruit fly) hypothetical protein n=1 Tax=Ceratitis capitata TaxID=7213 RepID=A0A811UTT9_CERCA|nr:unnamed protein product [Ceratitis capitata]